jgi:hypothetical protein
MLIVTKTEGKLKAVSQKNSLKKKDISCNIKYREGKWMQE